MRANVLMGTAEPVKRVATVKRAGAWRRGAAAVTDLTIVYSLALGFVTLSRLFHQYVPLELTLLVMLLIQAHAFLIWKGRTPAKMLFGLQVCRTSGAALTACAVFLRETLGKFIGGVVLPIGIAWTLFNGKEYYRLFPIIALVFVVGWLTVLLIVSALTKRSWYDALAGTVVLQDNRHRPLRKAATLFVFVALATCGWLKFRGIFSLITTAKNLTSYAISPTPYEGRTTVLSEISELDPANDNRFIVWLDQHGRLPVDYVVEKARQHQVTIVGESHFNRDHLLLLHEAIPRLYHEAGVRCLGLEVCTRADNEAIHHLITAPEYSRGLALRIARAQFWHNWGGKEYWDIFEAVWRLNRTLADDQPKMRVVGIDRRTDAISFSLGFPGDDAVKGPFWEKMRILRVLPELPKFFFRDESMAREIEREIIEKGDRGLVWVGRHHSFVNYKQPGQKKGRMAYILHQKWGDGIFQIWLHSEYPSPTIVHKDYSGPQPEIKHFLERIMAVRHHAPVGFDISGSPFMRLRDSAAYYFHDQPTVGLGDLALGYVYLGPESRSKKCEWIDGFITSDMFARYRPFYEADARRPFRNATDVNDFYRANR